MENFVTYEKDYESAVGGTLHYTEVCGKGKEPLVLLHGSGMCREDYAMVYPYLADEFHIYSVDWFGHGKSSKKYELYTGVNNGEAVTGFVRDVVAEPCIIAGHSVSGFIAVYAAGHAPEL